MSAWLGVVSRSHVQRGIGLGIAQVMHGRRAGLARMKPDDWLVYYSSQTAYPVGESLKAFTAIGRIVDNDIWQVDEGDFHPYRRRVDYLPLEREVPVAEVSAQLELTAASNWGYQLRRGLIPLSDADLHIIRCASSRAK